MKDILEKNYFEDLQKIKDTIKTNQYKAMVVVNSSMILTYYEIGRIINQRKTWGNKYIERLAEDLKEFGSGFSFRNLNRMARFYRIFSSLEIMPQVAAQIPWITFDEISQQAAGQITFKTLLFLNKNLSMPYKRLKEIV